MHPHQLQMPPTAPTPRARPKRATAPLDAAARARLAALPRSTDDSSGSEHDAAPALSSLVNEYLLEADATVRSSTILAAEASSDPDDDPDGTNSSPTAAADTLEEIRANLDPDDEQRRRLVFAVADAMRGLDDLRPNRSAFRRAVMSRLRERGHDAGLCKARWDKSDVVAAGSHEYIDVVVTGGESETRYVVDVSFAAGFEVARPTVEYEAVRAVLPEVMVARHEHLKRVVKLAASAARRSLKRSGLSVPPWRKRRFMMAKWLGPYKRTVNSVPASAGTALASSGMAGICRTIVGFLPPPAVVGTSSDRQWG
ncbi:uncharacterized protein LOC124695388 [Lolium rigidum]|uniref:uncharacterized protein LOC124695388 n=1 Tax=Lolium rigidum TaxID=89674 RepID=UPI001F5CCF3E|nr:uncharacterized protein LOC124695388 [Lolium rigidum]